MTAVFLEKSSSLVKNSELYLWFLLQFELSMPWIVTKCIRNVNNATLATYEIGYLLDSACISEWEKLQTYRDADIQIEKLKTVLIQCFDLNVRLRRLCSERNVM